jgi:hypothetical protein
VWSEVLTAVNMKITAFWDMTAMYVGYEVLTAVTMKSFIFWGRYNTLQSTESQPSFLE